jgi:glycosyltransferase involved in cell wall biosynthesis
LNSVTRVLFVSYTFPPDAAVGGLRISRLCRHLPPHGIEPVVLSVQEKFYDRLDHSVVLPPQLRVQRTGAVLTPLDWYRRAKQLFASKVSGAYTGNGRGNGPAFLRRQALALLEIPDPYWGWYFPALRAGEKLIQELNIDVIFSSGPPWISHLVAKQLKTRYKLPWVADFRDPWAHFLPEAKGPRWRQRLQERLERQTIRTADLVICNTDRLREAFANQYSELDGNKFRTLTNGYEDATVSATAKSDGERRVFLHLGSIYGLRRVDTFLEAIANLIRSGKLNPDGFKLVFQGDLSPGFMVAAEHNVQDLKNKGCLEFHPRVNRDQAQSVLWNADLLLLFQGNHELQVPAKFYEYLQTGIPIFAVTEDGALTDLLSSTRSGLWATPSDSNLIAERFLQILQMPQRTPSYIESSLSQQFHYGELTAKFGEWIQEVAKRGVRPASAVATPVAF